MTGESRCSAWRMRIASASSPACFSRPRSANNASNERRARAAPRKRATVASMSPTVAEARQSRNACDLRQRPVADEGGGLRAFEQRRLTHQRDNNKGEDVEPERQRAPPTKGEDGEADQRGGPRPGQAQRAFLAAPGAASRRRRAREAATDRPRRASRRSCPPPRRPPCRAAIASRRGRPARSARPPRTTAGRSRRARRRWRSARRRSRAPARRGSPSGARTAPSAPISPAAARACARGRLSRIGITRSLETVIASATLSTTTIAVAAEMPPIIVVSARTGAPALSGSASTVRSRSKPPCGNFDRPATASGSTNTLIAIR